MAKGKGFFQSKAFKVTMSRIYGWGASVVIVGALFKILHWKGADVMLMIGLLTEAFIFFISAFEPVKEEVDWTLVYPELAGMDPKKEQEKKSLTKELDKMLEEARIEQGMVNRLGEGLRNLTENVNKMSIASDAAMATTQYAEGIKQAANAVVQMNQSYARALEAIENMADAEPATRELKDGFNRLSDNLSSLNTVYGNMLSAMSTAR